MVQEIPLGTSPFPIVIHANASMPSELFANATLGTGSTPFVNTTYANLVNASANLAPATYNLSGRVQTEAGGQSLTPTARQYDLSHATASPLMVSFSCPITVVNVNLNVSNLVVSDIGETTALVTWSTNVPSLSEVRVDEAGVGQILDTETTNLSTGHTLSLHGLDPFSFYTVSVGALLPSAAFHTLAHFTVSEKDLPYDSITQEGGGALVSWDLPEMAQFNYLGGYLQYFPAASTQGVNVPLDTLSRNLAAVSLYSYVENLSTLTPDTIYTVYVYLNLSITNGDCQPCTLTAFGSSGFTYLKDTSGDGLSDAEKQLGWYVTYTDLQGGTHTSHVTADPQLYATNGLVSDYVEKEFALNASTLDTSGSHLLDTWNLTFDLGSNSIPSNIQAWSEPSFDPFQAAPAPGIPAPGNPLGVDLTNLSVPPAGGDNSPYAAEVLWDYNSLLYLNGLAHTDHDWLRAVTGSWTDSHHAVHNTLTVWGKLSWGANPLAASTYGDGIADGSRVYPLGPVDLQVSLFSWNADHVQQGFGGSVFVCGSEPGGPDCGLYGSYTTPATPAATAGSIGFALMTVTFPVDNTQQFADFNLTLVLNSGTSNHPVYSTVVDTREVSVDLADLTLQAPPTAQGSDSAVSGVTGSIEFTYQVVPASAKAPTYLWVPSDNSTLSNLPTGLQRYTGEQDFDLLVLNDTANQYNSPYGFTVANVPNPGDHGTYNVSLQPGLTNVLVPRGAFLSSPLGQALLNGTNESVPTSTDRGILTWTPWAWNNRAEGLHGITPTSQDFINVFTSTSQSCTSGMNCGGVASNPNIEGGNEALQVQAVFWVNVSEEPNYNFSNGNSELTDLLGGLLLNGSGNVSGSLRNVTKELPTLGFSGNVMAALANAVLPNDGGWGAPPADVHPPSPPQPWWQVAGTVLWNTVSGVVGLISVAWDATVAAATYLLHAAQALSDRLGITALVSQAAKALEAVAKVMEAVLQALLAYILSLIETLLTTGFRIAWNAISVGLSTVTGLVETAGSAIAAAIHGTGTTSEASPAVGSELVPFTIMAASVLVLMDIALGIAAPVSIGVDILSGLLLTALVSIVATVIPSVGGGFFNPVASLISSATNLATNALVIAVEGLFNFTENAFFHSSLTSGGFTVFDHSHPDGIPDPTFSSLTSSTDVAGTAIGALAIALSVYFTTGTCLATS